MNKHFSKLFESRKAYEKYILRGNKRGFFMWFLECLHVESDVFSLKCVLMSPEYEPMCVTNVTPLDSDGKPCVRHNVEYSYGEHN